MGFGVSGAQSLRPVLATIASLLDAAGGACVEAVPPAAASANGPPSVKRRSSSGPSHTIGVVKAAGKVSVLASRRSSALEAA